MALVVLILFFFNCFWCLSDTPQWFLDNTQSHRHFGQVNRRGAAWMRLQYWKNYPFKSSGNSGLITKRTHDDGKALAMTRFLFGPYVVITLLLHWYCSQYFQVTHCSAWRWCWKRSPSCWCHCGRWCPRSARREWWRCGSDAACSHTGWSACSPQSRPARS